MLERFTQSLGSQGERYQSEIVLERFPRTLAVSRAVKQTSGRVRTLMKDVGGPVEE